MSLGEAALRDSTMTNKHRFGRCKKLVVGPFGSSWSWLLPAAGLALLGGCSDSESARGGDAGGGGAGTGGAGASGAGAPGGSDAGDGAICGKRPGGSLASSHVLRFETADASWVVQLERRYEEWGAGESRIYALDGFAVVRDAGITCMSAAEDLEYVNTHHNWEDVARATDGALHYELAIGFLEPPTFTVYDMDGTPQLEAAELVVTGGPPFCFDCPAKLPISISEVMTDNVSTFADDSGNFGPWIELYNPSSSDVDLTGWTLSNDFDDRRKWSLPAQTLERHGVIVLFADGEPEGGPLHTSFRLSEGTGEVVLTAPDGTTDGGFVYPDMAAGESIAWNWESGAYVLVDSPSPGDPPVE